jgi:hypothetical protein
VAGGTARVRRSEADDAPEQAVRILGVGLELQWISGPYFLQASMQMEKVETQFACWAGVTLRMCDVYKDTFCEGGVL